MKIIRISRYHRNINNIRFLIFISNLNLNSQIIFNFIHQINFTFANFVTINYNINICNNSFSTLQSHSSYICLFFRTIKKLKIFFRKNNIKFNTIFLIIFLQRLSNIFYHIQMKRFCNFIIIFIKFNNSHSFNKFWK